MFKNSGRMAGPIALMSGLLLAAAMLTTGSAAIASPATAGSLQSLADVNLASRTNLDEPGKRAVKGRLPGSGTERAAANSCALRLDCFFRYGLARTQGQAVDGGRGYFTIEKPRLAASDYHSLAELSVTDGTGKQIVEIGWTVDRGLFGDSDPHLFVYHWVDGQETCYNGCGFVPSNEPGYSVGMKLPVSSTPRQFSILHRGSEWVMGYNGHRVGSFPDALWGKRFKLGSQIQWFGEVASSIPNPCTDMGNGQPAASPTAARIQDMALAPGSTPLDIAAFAVPQTPTLYTAIKTGPTSIRYGGIGDCRTVPDLVGGLASQAPKRITDAGLTVGGSSTIQDPECENLLRVIAQSPAAGTTRVAGGSKVTYRYGVEPRNGCPDTRQ